MADRPMLDEIDLRMLAILQDEGRITNVELGQRVGLTAPPSLRRLRALEEAGVILGYHARLNAVALGWPIVIFAMVSLKSQAAGDLEGFERHIAQLPEVRECHMLNGEIDFLLKCAARDLPSFQRFLQDHLISHPTVASVKTSSTIRTSKALVGVPVEP